MTPRPGCHLRGSPCPSMAGSLPTPALLQRSPWSRSPAPSSIGAGKEPSPYLWSSVGRDAPVPRNVSLPSAAHAGTPGSPFHANSPLALAKQHGFDDK